MVRDKNTIYAEKNEDGVFVYQEKSLQTNSLIVSVTFPSADKKYVASLNKNIEIQPGLMSMFYVDSYNIHIPNIVTLSANQVFITDSDLTLKTINKEDVGL